MNKVGIQEVIDVANDYFNIQISEKWLLENLDEISTFFPAEDDEWYLQEYKDDDVWWTFEKECENQSLSDTSAREMFAEAIAQILTGDGWPIYADGVEVSNQFYHQLEKACSEQEGITYEN